MEPELLLPASNYLFTLPSDEPCAAGVLRRTEGATAHEGHLLDSWSPTFVLFYPKTSQLRRATQELIRISGRLVGEYDLIDEQQLTFTFGRSTEDDVEFFGGLTLDILNMPPGVMHHHPWGIALVPDGGAFPHDVVAFYAGSQLLRFSSSSTEDSEE